VNGELYDDEYYRNLLGTEYDFRSRSDCEIVLALYKHYGLSFLSHLRGEFALILWDARRKVFIGARDRFGVKSLYYTIVNNQLLVATEMKCFLPFGWKPEWDVQGLRECGWVFGTGTMFKGVQSVCCPSILPILRVFLMIFRLLRVTIFQAGTSVLSGIQSIGMRNIRTR
jgi:asparagine synthase (glutamine-hydrolysing)